MSTNMAKLLSEAPRGAQARIVEDTGLSAAFVSNCFTGKRAIPTDRIDAFADAVGVSAALMRAAKACDAVEFEASQEQLETIAGVLEATAAE